MVCNFEEYFKIEVGVYDLKKISFFVGYFYFESIFILRNLLLVRVFVSLWVIGCLVVRMINFFDISNFDEMYWLYIEFKKCVLFFDEWL